MTFVFFLFNQPILSKDYSKLGQVPNKHCQMVLLVCFYDMKQNVGLNILNLLHIICSIKTIQYRF